MAEQERPSLEQIKQQCIFCQIVNGQVPGKKVYEDDKVLAVLDINPANPGHILVLTKEHYAIMPQIPEETIGHLGKIAKALSHVLLNTLKLEGTTIFVANGPAAGQRAQHFMMHVIPRGENDGMGLFLQEKELPVEMIEKLKQALAPGIKKNLGVDLTVKPAEQTVDLGGVANVLTGTEDDAEESSDDVSIDDITKIL